MRVTVGENVEQIVRKDGGVQELAQELVSNEGISRTNESAAEAAEVRRRKWKQSKQRKDQTKQSTLFSAWPLEKISNGACIPHTVIFAQVRRGFWGEDALPRPVH